MTYFGKYAILYREYLDYFPEITTKLQLCKQRKLLQEQQQLLQS